MDNTNFKGGSVLDISYLNIEQLPKLLIVYKCYGNV